MVAKLGLQWKPTQDFFCYKVSLPPKASNTTKRVMLSEIARLYDLLGWPAPVLVIDKIMIQKLWITGHDWNQEVPDEIRSPWNTLRGQLSSLESLRIPRWLGTTSSSRYCLHSFADASSFAYAACIYLVTQEDGRNPRSTLLVAKSKVAPIKTVSILRLLLRGAQLLARLIDIAVKHLGLTRPKVYCWLDS